MRTGDIVNKFVDNCAQDKLRQRGGLISLNGSKLAPAQEWRTIEGDPKLLLADVVDCVETLRPPRREEAIARSLNATPNGFYSRLTRRVPR
jgi:hypothetical protein